jgi:hypothetical protein
VLGVHSFGLGAFNTVVLYSEPARSHTVADSFVQKKA